MNKKKRNKILSFFKVIFAFLGGESKGKRILKEVVEIITDNNPHDKLQLIQLGKEHIKELYYLALAAGEDELFKLLGDMPTADKTQFVRISRNFRIKLEQELSIIK